MKKLIKIILSIFILFTNLISIVKADEDPPPGYSPWSTNQTGDENEISVLQYGRKIPIKWSEWSEYIPTSKYQRKREGIKKHYANRSADAAVTYENAYARHLYTWTFSSRRKFIYFYADVDTYRFSNNTSTNYEGPPMQLYCDGTLIASTGKHNELENWNPSINTYCTSLTLNMSSNSDGIRNRTMIVGTYVGSLIDEYSYVILWSQGQDWRQDKEYEHITGSDPQIPTSRIVYSHPLTYKINYVLDGGTANGELVSTYTVLDEVNLPSVSKKAHDFLGWYDQNGNKYEKINKGTYGDLTLYARYEKRIPNLEVGYTYFDVDKDKQRIDINEVINKSEAKAYDKKLGDISDDIKIISIIYKDKNKTIDNPSYLEIDEKDMVTITFYVKNDVEGEAIVKRNFYIIGKGNDIEEYIDNIKIYSRYISEEYYKTLDSNSIWQSSAYKQILNETFN